MSCCLSNSRTRRPRQTRRSALAGVILIVTAACSTVPTDTTVTIYDDDYQGSGDSTISLLWRRPTVPHEDLAVIEVTGKRNATREDILARMREQGIALGADAVVTNLHPALVLAPVEFQAAGSGIHASRTKPHLIGVAIRYCDTPLDDAARREGCREFRAPGIDETTIAPR